MKRSTTISAAILFVMSGFIGCNQPKPKSEGFITVDVTATYPKKELILQDFMDVEYIPLESTDSFITMAHVQDIGEDVIIVRNRNRSSDGNIFIFDKKGKGLRKINRQGAGGEEYTFLLKAFLDEDNNELFVNDHRASKMSVYDLFGQFKRSFKHKEGCIFDPVYNFDKNNLICLDYISDFEEEPKNRFFIVSKQDGSITKEIQIPYKVKKSTVLTVTDEAKGVTVSNATRNEELIPYFGDWLLVDPSSDTIYKSAPDFSLTPFIVRTPSIQSMIPEIFLFPGVFTDRYYFLQTVKKEYDFTTNSGFPRTDLVYDQQEKAIYEYTVLNADFSTKKLVNMVYEITLINDDGIAFVQRLEAPELIEANENGELKGKLKEIASTLDEESNPVLMLARYKK
ncbi:MAG: 6-bladed beta-propeller [Bacteroidota bacterium]|nr:6-bladed beta-propeller [Bacteroidota bacterium]